MPYKSKLLRVRVETMEAAPRRASRRRSGKWLWAPWDWRRGINSVSSMRLSSGTSLGTRFSPSPLNGAGGRPTRCRTPSRPSSLRSTARRKRARQVQQQQVEDRLARARQVQQQQVEDRLARASPQGRTRRLISARRLVRTLFRLMRILRRTRARRLMTSRRLMRTRWLTKT
ncbi:unnamed protein product [Discosporangium mesarthrocarpum]